MIFGPDLVQEAEATISRIKDNLKAAKSHQENYANKSVGVFCTGKNRMVKIVCSSFEMVLRTTKHTMIYHSSNTSLEVIALHPVV
jgi:acid stress-induced BolA-like protein IbaG/YrbA